MKRVSLYWSSLGNVADLFEKLKQKVTISDEQHPLLRKWGFYMYFDPQKSEASYIGQAFGESRSLRNRIRHEILKDNSRFSHDCTEFGIDKFSLLLKVAYLKEATENGNPIELIDSSIMNAIESALICQMTPKINRRGKKRYRKENIEIHNEGDFTPLAESFRKETGEKCVKKQD